MNEIGNHSTEKRRARLATLAEIQREVVPLWLDPAPTAATLRNWFKIDHVQRLKANPFSKRGGGPVYFLIADVEKSFRRRITASSGCGATSRFDDEGPIVKVVPKSSHAVIGADAT